MLAPIVTTEQFDKDAASLKPHYPRIDDVVSGVCWGLIHEPYAGEPVPGHDNRYIYLTSPVEYVTPIFRVLYKFSDSNPRTIVLLAIGSTTDD